MRGGDDTRTGIERTQNIDPKHLAYNAQYRDDATIAHLSPYARRCLGFDPHPSLAAQPKRGAR